MQVYIRTSCRAADVLHGRRLECSPHQLYILYIRVSQHNRQRDA